MLRYIYCHAGRHSSECRYAERRVLFIVMLNVIMLKVITLKVIMPSVMASCMHDPMRCFQNAAAYFTTLVSYARKMFEK